MSVVDDIKRKSGTEFRPANPTSLDALRSLGVPAEALTFYQESEPVRTAEIGKVRLCPISHIIVENRDYVPGCYAQPCGYVVFATTICGDAFCFDTQCATNLPVPIVLIAHDLEPDNDEMRREDLAKLAKPVAPSFESFLEAFASEMLDIEPLYPPFDLGNSGDQRSP